MNPQMVQIEVSIPEDVYLSLKVHGLTREQLAQQVREALAVHFYREHVLSLGKAARLAGLDRWRFIDLLGKQQVPVVDLDEKELAQEMAAVEQILEDLRQRNDP